MRAWCRPSSIARCHGSAGSSSLVEIVEVVRAVRACRDPDDDRFLEVAVNGDADVIVSGDRDLLVLHPFQKIAILTPADYLARAFPESD